MHPKPEEESSIRVDASPSHRGSKEPGDAADDTNLIQLDG